MTTIPVITLTSDAPLPINPSWGACRLPATFEPTLTKIIHATTLIIKTPNASSLSILSSL